MTKKLLVLLSITAGIFAVACKKETSGNTTKSPVTIVGKWSYLKDSINFYTNGVLKSSRVERYNNEYMQFNANGTGSDALKSFTYTLSDNKLTLNFAAYTSGGYTYPAEKSVANIIELSDKKLYFYYDYIATGNNSIYATLSR